MGLDMTYKNRDKKLTFRLSTNDIEVLEFLRKKELKKAIDIIFGVERFGKETHVKYRILLQKVEKLLKVLGNKPQLLPYVYFFKHEIPRGGGTFSVGSEGSSGFKINGIPHYIEVGLEKCQLSKLRQNEYGKQEEYDTTDVRNLKVIKVDEDDFFGDIMIYKKRKPTKLLKNLKKLHSFLVKSKSDEIIKILG